MLSIALCTTLASLPVSAVSSGQIRREDSAHMGAED